MSVEPIRGLSIGPIPTYAEAVAESHRTGHEWLWEIDSDGSMSCKLCGFVDSERTMLLGDR